jgi:hypothetical protein
VTNPERSLAVTPVSFNQTRSTSAVKGTIKDWAWYR